MQLVVTAVIISTVALAHLCSAQLPCNGVVSGTITNDVTCTGDCVLDNAMITGNVVCSTGTLVAKGSSTISGNLLADGTVTRVKLDAVTVSGNVDVLNANSLEEIVILQAANINSVNIDNTPGNLNVSGSLNTIEMLNSGNLVADSLMTIGGITVKGGDGDIEICGSSIGGTLSVEDHSGNINIDADIVNCDPTTITGGVSVLRGSNAVTIRGANLPSGDLSILENTGTIILGQVQVSDVKLQGNTGDLTTINDLSTDSDVEITEHVGDILLSDLTIAGDTNINNVNGMVTLTDSDFNLEVVSITQVSGDLTVQDNTNLKLTVEEIEGGVEIINNTITVASVNKNTGGVVINDNTITELLCSDNTPAPTGINNNITGIADGQCALLQQ